VKQFILVGTAKAKAIGLAEQGHDREVILSSIYSETTSVREPGTREEIPRAEFGHIVDEILAKKKKDRP